MTAVATVVLLNFFVANHLLFASPVPLPLSSFHVFSTTTTAHLKWKLHRQQSMSTLTLYDLHTQSVTHFSDINPSEIKSEYTIKGLQPGTRFRAEVTVAIFLKQLDITLKQKLSIFLETGIVHICSTGIR